MTAEEAYKESLKTQLKLIAESSEIREVFEKIKDSVSQGEFKCHYYNDDEIRKSLRLLGYDVSEVWIDSRWYGDEMMTISWSKKYEFEEK